MSTIANLLSPQITERLGWTLVHFVWQATAVGLLLAVALYLLRRASAHIRYMVSCLALVLIATLPLVTMPFLDVAGSAAEAGPAPALPVVTESTPVEVIEVTELPAESFEAVPLETMASTVPVPWREQITARVQPALPYLVLGWLVGVFGLSAWHLGGWAQLQRLKRRLVCEVAAPLQTKLGQLAERLGVRRAVTLLESALVEVPTVVGWIKPVILLPASALTGLNGEQLEAILAHELAHIRRCDYLVNILQTVVEILGFYHPAVWWVSHRIRDERENCCDDLAVRVCGDSVRYAKALTHLEEMRHRGMELAVAATGGSLVGRIARLIGRPAPTRNRFAWLPGLIALLLVASIVIPAALVLAAPAPAESDPVAAGLPTQEAAPAEAPQEATASAQAVVAAQAHNDGQRQDQAKVLVTIVIAKVLTGATLDRETMLSVAAILADEDPQIASEILDAEQTVTLGDILNKYVGRRPLPPATTEALVDLLESRGYLKTQSKPSVLTWDNTQAVIKTITEEYFQLGIDPTSPPQRIELGAVVHVTPHVPSPISDSIRLEFSVTWTERAPQSQPDAPPTLRTAEIESTVTLLNDHCFPLLVEPDKKEDAGAQDPESLLVMLTPSIIEPAQMPADVSATQAQQTDDHPRQVLLDVRTLAMDHGDLLNLPFEWGTPAFSRAEHIQIGYVADRARTDSLLAAVRRLLEQGRVNVMSNPRVLALEGQQSRIRAVTQEWYSQRKQADPQAPGELVTITSGTTLAFTAHVDDNSNITLEMEFEASDVIPRGRRNNLPVVARRTTKNTVTVGDGGTVALAELSVGRTGQNDQAMKEVVILVTAQIVGDDNVPGAARTAAGDSVKAQWREDGISSELLTLARQHADGRIHALTEEIATLEVELVRARQMMTEKHPQVTAMRNRIEVLNRHIDETRQGLKQEPLVLARQQVVSSDPTIRALNEEIAKLEVDLVRARQTSSQSNPQIVTIRNHVAALQKRSDEKREELEQEFNKGLAKRLETRAGEQFRTVTKSLITAAFADADLQEALAEISRRAGVQILADETVAGRVSAELKNVSLAIALEIVLAGTPCVVKKMPDYYLVTTRARLAGSEVGDSKKERMTPVDRSVVPPEEPGKRAVEIAMRLLSLSDAFMDALESRLPLKGVPSPADANTLHGIGRQVLEAGQVVLDDAQLGLLLKAVQAREDAKSLASPKVTVMDGEPAQFSLGENIPYVAGYAEPDDVADPPVPDVKEIMTGLEMKLTARIAAEDRIKLDLGLTLTSIDGYEEKTYGNALRYGVPKIDRIEFPMNDLSIPDGQTILVAGPRARRPLGRDDAVEPPAPLLILLTVRQTMMEDREESLSMPVPGQLPGGFGGFGVGGPKSFGSGYGYGNINPSEPRPMPSRN